MKYLVTVLGLVLFFKVMPAVTNTGTCGSKSGGPQENPIATLYGNGTYSWADAMVNWSCIYNVKDYGGSFESAQKAATEGAGGGGVVYFPAGTYSFSTNITIESNVVIRGEPSTDMAKKGTSPGTLSPKTIFKCTFGEHIGIFNSDPKGKNFGIINVELDGCAVMFWPALKSSSKGFKSYWWTAEDVIGMGQNKVVIGNKIHDVTYQHPNPDTNDSIIWPWSFSTAIACYSDNNTLVANNLISKSTTSKKTTVTLDGDKLTVPYLVDNRYGIDVNQILLGGVIGKYMGHQCPHDPGTLTPSCAPWYFRRGLVIRDNYVYMNGRVGVSWSGGGDGKTVGSGTLVYNNHVEVASGTTCWSVNGVKKMTGHDTNENRGYDQKGYENNITMNTGHINRQKAADTPYMTVDGEGILQQAVNGNDGLRSLWYKNDLSGGSTGYLAYYNLFNVEYNQLIVSIMCLSTCMYIYVEPTLQ